MANLRERHFDSTQVKGRYRQRVEIYVEGKDDSALFKNFWFSDLIDRVDFIEAENGPINHSGCEGVRKNVAVQRQRGIPAYGVIDRDALPDVLLANETDDSSYFSQTSNQYSHLHYTLLWEIENYLIDPEALEQYRADSKTMGEARPIAVVEKEIREHCEALLPHAACNALLQTIGKKKLPDEYTYVHADRMSVAQHIHTTELPKYDSAAQSANIQNLAQVDAFDDPSQTDRVRIRMLKRRIHGKALLKRFAYQHKLKGEIPFHVARKISTMQSPLNELRDQIEVWLS